ncbi:MAG: glycoside hydrolase TIM-barrel-like domain-containing protein [Planctomycetota bacterium]
MQTHCVFWLAALLLSVSGCATPYVPPPRSYPLREPWRGVALLHLEDLDGRRGYGTAACEASIDNAVAVGVNAISLRVPARQPSIHDPQIRFGVEPPHGETDARIVAAIRQSRDRGLSVMLKPHIMLDRITDKEWRGRIDFEDPADLDEWWRNYNTFVLHYANLAETENVECFCVGVELLDMVRRAPERWSRLIKDVRTIYNGKLTYAANWDEEFQVVPFWGELDMVGVQCFFPVTESEQPTQIELREGMQAIAEELHRVARDNGKTLLLTEVGFKSTRGATIKPWEWPSEDTVVDLQQQARAYEAVLDVLEIRPWFAGLFWWNWLTEPAPGDKADRIFTPQDKPAEALLRERWGR